MQLADLIAGGPAALRKRGATVAAEMLDYPWLRAKDLDSEGRAEEAQWMRRRALAVVTGWDDCPECGRAFQPSPSPDRLYSRCFTCSQLAWASGSVACAICGKRHSMKHACCFFCKQEKLEDEAAFVRSMINRRDGYACQMCGAGAEATETEDDYDDSKIEGISLEVDFVRPISLGGQRRPWNRQTLCVPCKMLKGDRFGPQDDAEVMKLMEAYSLQLADYLNADERRALRSEMDYQLGGDLRGAPPVGLRIPDHGTCDDGILNLVVAFPGYTLAAASDLAPAKSWGVNVELQGDHLVNTVTGLDYGPINDPCAGHVFGDFGRRDCTNLVNRRVAALCEGPCR